MPTVIKKQYTDGERIKTAIADTKEKHLSTNLKDGNDTLMKNFLDEKIGGEKVVAVLDDDRRGTFHRYIYHNLHEMVKYHRSIGIKHLLDFTIYFWGSVDNSGEENEE